MGAEVNRCDGTENNLPCDRGARHHGACRHYKYEPSERPKAGIESTLVERGSRYGSFASQSALAQSLEDIMRAAAHWPDTTPSQREAFSMISIKIARLLNGDPNYADGWHDIAGYAKLVEDEIHEQDERELPES
jgi:hypothetical protein